MKNDGGNQNVLPGKTFAAEKRPSFSFKFDKEWAVIKISIDIYNKQREPEKEVMKHEKNNLFNYNNSVFFNNKLHTPNTKCF